MDNYLGSCHCGRVRFQVLTSLDYVLECNCSICSRKGILHQRIEPQNFKLLTGEEALSLYQFGTLAAKHFFCSVCGIHVFTRPRAAPDKYTVNVRCLENIVLKQLVIHYFDGQNWEQSVNKLSVES